MGFRPFVYRIALENELTGTVENRNDGVVIYAEGEPENIDKFLKDLELKAPPASKVLSMNVEKSDLSGFNAFIIKESSSVSAEVTLVSPDIAVCDDCLEDMKSQPHRLDYPFINCTNCGPRFTIIKDLPYDRPSTTMSVFKMCDKCAGEYSDVSNRRFHAQPVACNNCGPHYSLYYNSERINRLDDILAAMSSFLKEGKVIAVKGLGGYFLACDAFNPDAVNSLRDGKRREGKPFAVMFSSLESIQKHAWMNDTERKWLQSWRRPVVLLDGKKGDELKGVQELAGGVSSGLPGIGAMLPYMPFHYLLFERSGLDAIVLTSGNFSDEPILISDDMALNEFLAAYDAVLCYDREIYNRVDDSVGMVVNDRERIIRRSRGYVPSPVELDIDVDGIIAAGAELVNSFCLGKGSQAFLSQHIGDLKNLETYEFYKESMARFIKLFRITPKMIVCDMHPDYLSSKYAARAGLPLMEVQHHHAHIASCMAEHRLDEKVIGIAFDGVGLGDDGNIWGGEFLLCDYENYRRLYHFEYVMMPGGDKATLNPWRMAVSYLFNTFGAGITGPDLPFLSRIDRNELRLVRDMLNKGINTPFTSSAGRLFDAVAALTGICSSTSFHAEAPMRLEAAIVTDVQEGHYDYKISGGEISFSPMIKQIVEDIGQGIAAGVISAKFHNTIIELIVEISISIREQEKLNKLVLSGGSFQNRYILGKAEKRLEAEGFMVYTPSMIPSNDGGISLGQLLIAAKRRKH